MTYAIHNGYMLVEMNSKKLDRLIAAGENYYPVTAATAHKYVRQGICHNTYLWIDMDGKIRRAN